MIKPKPATAKLPVLAQLCKLIPTHLTASLAKKHGIDKQARTFSAWSHVVTLLFAQLTHATSLNDVCDALFGVSLGSRCRTATFTTSCKLAKPPTGD